MLLNAFTYHAPKTLQEAANLYEALEDSRLLAGGTFLVNQLKTMKRKGLKTPAHIISLRKIESLRKFSREKGRLTVGAMTTINELRDSTYLKESLSILKDVCRNIGTNPIRNMGTVGGNLASRYPWTELGAALIALDATLHFNTSKGDKAISCEEFLQKNARSEGILKSVSFAHDTQSHLSYRRVKKLSDVDIPLLAVCVKMSIDPSRKTITSPRVAVNGGTFFATRDKKLEKFLDGKKINPQLTEECLAHRDLALYEKNKNEYKNTMFAVSLREALSELIKKAAQ